MTGHTKHYNAQGSQDPAAALQPQPALIQHAPCGPQHLLPFLKEQVATSHRSNRALQCDRLQDSSWDPGTPRAKCAKRCLLWQVKEIPAGWDGRSCCIPHPKLRRPRWRTWHDRPGEVSSAAEQAMPPLVCPSGTPARDSCNPAVPARDLPPPPARTPQARGNQQQQPQAATPTAADAHTSPFRDASCASLPLYASVRASPCRSSKHSRVRTQRRWRSRARLRRRSGLDAALFAQGPVRSAGRCGGERA